NPHTSTRKAAGDNEIDKKSVAKILKKNKFHPYKMTFVQELAEDDFDRRLEFCETMLAKFETDDNLHKKIVFSDEATFEITGSVNKHNCRYWSENPLWIHEKHTQHRDKVNVWAGIINNQIIGPFFIDGNLNGLMYEEMLR
ncbi:hypothetical protein EAG_15649, partial [Camponotus floridanus]